MRFLLFDKIIGLKKGAKGTGIKNITLGEDFFIKHYDKTPIMPEPLIIESIAQVGGWVIAVSCNYKYSAIMVMVGRAKFYNLVRPGDQLIIHVELLSSNDYGSTIQGVAKVNDIVVAEVDKLAYVHHELSEEMKKEVINTYIYNSGGFLDREGNLKVG